MRVFQRWMLITLLVCCPVGEGLAQKKSFWRSLTAFMDSSNVKGVDPAYIIQPDKPWAIVLNSNIDKLDLEVETTEYYENYIDKDKMTELTMRLQVKPPVSTSIGLWAGYRGWGAGYSLSLSGDKGYAFAMNLVSPSYGLNLRINRFSFDQPIFAMSWDGSGSIGTGSEMYDNMLYNPIKIGTLVFDGYWVFNKRRFSMLAAYDQSTIQLRSAGSLIAGLMYYYQKLDFDTPKNMVTVGLFTDMRLMRVYQGSVGLGYTYNWVPARRWVVNVTAMPVLTLLNRVKASKYRLKFPDNSENYSREKYSTR